MSADNQGHRCYEFLQAFTSTNIARHHGMASLDRQMVDVLGDDAVSNAFIVEL